VALGNVATSFDPAPVPGGPAGTFRITNEFTNTALQTIANPFAEVAELSGGNLLLNVRGRRRWSGCMLETRERRQQSFPIRYDHDR
jgi:hypothetical protein